MYVHLPFCRQRCAYCHFQIKVLRPRVTEVPESQARALVQGLKKEFLFQRAFSPMERIETLFVGGGTPSVFPRSLLADWMAWVYQQPGVQLLERTIELNPEDIDEVALEAWQAMGFDRFSVGVQCFHDEVLSVCGRRVRAEEMRRILGLVRRQIQGKRLNLDLIVGLPGQNAEKIAANIEWALEAEPDHVSLYFFERDQPVPLLKRPELLPQEDEVVDWFEAARLRLEEAGFLHYELSNFARPGSLCQHNVAHWRGGSFFGLGPSAHGRLGRRLTRNLPTLNAYLERMSSYSCPWESVDVWDKGSILAMNRIQSLRLWEGVPDQAFSEAERSVLVTYDLEGLTECRHGCWRLTSKGRLISNSVFASLWENREMADTSIVSRPRGVGRE
jgi:oxygen-independent coproporphyrinogen-3 oxidase